MIVAAGGVVCAPSAGDCCACVGVGGTDVGGVGLRKLKVMLEVVAVAVGGVVCTPTAGDCCACVGVSSTGVGGSVLRKLKVVTAGANPEAGDASSMRVDDDDDEAMKSASENEKADE